MSRRCQTIKKISDCQKDVKCQKVKLKDDGAGSQKIIWQNEIHIFWHKWRSSKLGQNTFYGHFEVIKISEFNIKDNEKGSFIWNKPTCTTKWNKFLAKKVLYKSSIGIANIIDPSCCKWMIYLSAQKWSITKQP